MHVWVDVYDYMYSKSASYGPEEVPWYDRRGAAQAIRLSLASARIDYNIVRGRSID